MITCACGCGRTGPHKARGLIRACYDRALYHGTQHQYPPRSKTAEARAALRARIPQLHAAHRADRLARIEDYVDLREWGESREEAQARLGVTRRTTVRWHAWLRAQGATYSWLPPMPAHLVAA